MEESHTPLQAAERATRRRDADGAASYGNITAESADEADITSNATLALDQLDQLAGQDAVVLEVRARLAGIAAGADGGEGAHVFFFYGFPGTGKSYLAELIAGYTPCSFVLCCDSSHCNGIARCEGVVAYVEVMHPIVSLVQRKLSSYPAPVKVRATAQNSYGHPIMPSSRCKTIERRRTSGNLSARRVESRARAPSPSSLRAGRPLLGRWWRPWWSSMKSRRFAQQRIFRWSHAVSKSRGHAMILAPPTRHYTLRHSSLSVYRLYLTAAQSMFTSLRTIGFLFPQARPDFMTSALVNAIDRRGFVEFSKKDADGDCSTQQCATPSAIT